jgi:rhodanese-related sulfurtransferase
MNLCLTGNLTFLDMHCFKKFLSITLGTVMFAASTFAAGERITVSQLQAWLVEENPPLIVDIRSAADYSTAHLPGAINIPANALERRKLPPMGRVVLYGGGLGKEDEVKALSLLAAKPGIQAYLLEGGFAVWQGSSLPAAVETGVTRDSTQMITYQEALQTLPEDAVIVDLRDITLQQSEAIEDGDAPVWSTPGDPVDNFAARLGKPLSRGLPPSAAPAAPGEMAPASMGVTHQPLLVLVDDNPRRAEETARRLRAQGHHRVVVLVGGVEIIQFEGRTGRQRVATGMTVEGVPYEE